ncbi:unnamed protein product [Prorocentrum cordatum]|uniref:Uncharacterized protein n=1 Tax=Prorocentrum cordatum TaxID=2364126 RepID=A0ABN9TE93_9DINO|nr:unnamed protein product [Polarella glacialis]
MARADPPPPPPPSTTPSIPIVLILLLLLLTPPPPPALQMPQARPGRTASLWAEGDPGRTRDGSWQRQNAGQREPLALEARVHAHGQRLPPHPLACSNIVLGCMSSGPFLARSTPGQFEADLE